MRCPAHVAYMGETRNALKVLARKPEQTCYSDDQGVYRRITLKRLKNGMGEYVQDLIVTFITAMTI